MQYDRSARLPFSVLHCATYVLPTDVPRYRCTGANTPCDLDACCQQITFLCSATLNEDFTLAAVGCSPPHFKRSVEDTMIAVGLEMCTYKQKRVLDPHCGQWHTLHTITCRHQSWGSDRLFPTPPKHTSRKHASCVALTAHSGGFACKATRDGHGKD